MTVMIFEQMNQALTEAVKLKGNKTTFKMIVQIAPPKGGEFKFGKRLQLIKAGLAYKFRMACG